MAVETLVASAVFFVFAITKQVTPVFAHAPWVNDPYDAVLSFTMFFVPLLAFVPLISISLCRTSQVLPIGRLVVVTRACRAAVVAMLIELLTAWVAFAVGANRQEWTVGSTGLLVVLLVVATIVAARAAVSLVRAPRLSSPAVGGANADDPDWLADMLTVAMQACSRFGLLRPCLTLLDWADQVVISRIRRHPLVSAAAASGVFAVAVFGSQALRERYSFSLTALEIGLGFCGMFAFLVTAGAYLRVVRSPNRLHGVRRRALDAVVAACVAAIAALAFRDSLWSLVGSSPSAAGPAPFAVLVGSSAVAALVAVFGAETLVGSHSKFVR